MPAAKYMYMPHEFSTLSVSGSCATLLRYACGRMEKFQTLKVFSNGGQ